MLEDAKPFVRLQTLSQLSRGATWRLELLHSYDHPVLLWITRGQGRAILAGIRRGVGVHNAIYLPAHTLIALDLGKQGMGLALHMSNDLEAGFPVHLTHLRVRDNHDQGDLTGHLDAIGLEAQKPDAFSNDVFDAHCRLISVFLRRHIANAPPTPRATAAERLVRAYAMRICDPGNVGQTMADHAESLGVTPTHLSRSCKTTSGLTAADFITQHSVFHARNLIETTNLPFNQIAQALGFGSAAYFTRFILAHTGQNPSALRNNQKK